MVLILHAGKTNKNAFKTLIAAEYSGVQVELAQNFEMGVSNKTPEFIKMNPIGKVPMLETPDGPIFESNAIARYVARLKSDNSLFGSSLAERGYVEQWIDFASLEIDANILNWFRPRTGCAVYLPPAEEAAISALKRGLGALNTYLASNTYLVGHAVTLADIIMTCNLYSGFTWVMTKSFTSEFPHVERYFWTMVNQPNFSKILGEVKQTEKVPPVQSTKKPSPPKEAAKPKPKDEPKREAKKEPAKPKEEAGEEEEEAPKPKPKKPLDLLPPSKMMLDEWKRLYSNTKTNFREVAIKVFYVYIPPRNAPTAPMTDGLNTTAPMADGLNTTLLAEISDEGSVVPSNNNATSDPNSSPPPPAIENSGGNFDIDEAAQPPEPNVNIRALIGSTVAQATSTASASFNMNPFGDTVREVVINYVVQPSARSLGSEIIDHLFVQRQNFNRRLAIMLFFFMLLLLLQRFLSAP